MPVIVIYRSRRSIVRERDGYCCLDAIEYGFAEAQAEERLSRGVWWHRRTAAEPIAIRAPPGELRRDAETAYRLACRGLEGFRVATGEEDMGRRRRDDGPTLFDGPAPAPEAPAATAPLADAVRRALDELARAIDGGEPARIVTARAILECALEDSGRAA